MDTQTQLITWQGVNLSFWLITVIVVVSAIFATFSRSIVRAAFSLFFTLFGMAGYYVLLGSDFVAVTQVIIYVGGILVLLMFGVLLTNRSSPGQDRVLSGFKAFALIPAVLLFVLLGWAAFSGQFRTVRHLSEPQSSVREIGQLLLSHYAVPFLSVGVTLLLCLLGAAFLVRRRDG